MLLAVIVVLLVVAIFLIVHPTDVDCSSKDGARAQTEGSGCIVGVLN
jgi:hypothetical protein